MTELLTPACVETPTWVRLTVLAVWFFIVSPLMSIGLWEVVCRLMPLERKRK